MFSSISSRFIIRSQSGLNVSILSITIFCWTLAHTFPHCKPKVSAGQQGRGLQSPASSWRPSLWALLQRGFLGQKPARSVSFCCFKKKYCTYIYIWDFEDCWSGLNMFEWFSLFTVVSKPKVLFARWSEWLAVSIHPIRINPRIIIPNKKLGQC